MKKGPSPAVPASAKRMMLCTRASTNAATLTPNVGPSSKVVVMALKAA